MSVKLIEGAVVRSVLAELGEIIRTKDVSRASEMLAAHTGLMPDGVYNASVGKYLAGCSDVQRLDNMPKSLLGQAWRNLLYAAPANADSSSWVNEIGAVDPVQSDLELGPQYPGDDSFTARMRLHQSWYRAKVLRVPCGVGPTAHGPNSYGNMLRASDAERGLNFLTPQIFEVATQRAAENPRNVKRFRLLHNLLSSQPLCFNLFAPLALDLNLATQLMAAVPELSVARVTSVVLETAPGPYLGDNTSFDVYMEYEQIDGKRAFLGVEVKLTEPFSEKIYERHEYRRLMDGERAPWRAEAAAQVANVAHNQLWRDHLLAIAHRDHPGSPFAQGRLMLLRHPEDRRCEQVVSNYRSLLRLGDDSLLDMTLDRLIAAWMSAALSGGQRAWLAGLEQRYLRLELSAPAGGAR